METVIDEVVKCIDLQAEILQLANDENYLASIELTAYPMQLSLHVDTQQMSLFDLDNPGTCCISFHDNALSIETGGEFSMAEDKFIKILRKFKKCCIEYALATHREKYEIEARTKKEQE